ncbi:MAG: hypothetical protein ACE5IJ_06870 [Thermoplasmata archaeon]
MARIIFDCSQGMLYLTKKQFENIAIDTDPENSPPIRDWSRELYLNEVLEAFQLNSATRYVGNVVKRFRDVLASAIDDRILSESGAGDWHKRIRAVVGRVNRVLKPRRIRLSEKGEVMTEAPYIRDEIIRDYVFDGLGRWALDDIRRLLENAEEHFAGGPTNPLRYNDCASNAAKAVEGVLRKALIEASSTAGHPDPSCKLKTMMKNAIRELENLGFWPDRAVKEAVDNYRQFLRNKAQHYDPAGLDIRMRGFDRPTAFFALWEAIALVGTILETLDGL